MTDNSFKIEGLELRVRQKPIAETVPQSTSRELSLRISPRIFLNDDGKLYFQDNVVRESVPLEKMGSFYDRIKYQDGELRFFDRNADTYIPLSQMTSESELIINTNSVLYSSRTLWEPDENFSAINSIETEYNKLREPITVSTSIVDAKDDRGIFWQQFTSSRLRHIDTEDFGKRIADIFIDQFVTGLRGYGEIPEASFCDDEDCTLQNLSFFLNDDKIGLSRLPTDTPGKIYLFNQNLLVLDNYIFTNLYNYNGVGRFIEKVFGPNEPSTTEVYNDYFFKEDGYTTVVDLGVPAISGFTIDALLNVQCGDTIISGGGNVGGYELGTVQEGWIAFRTIESNTVVATSIAENTPIPYFGCTNTNKIGTIECPLGEISFNGSYTAFTVSSKIDDFKVWYNDYDLTGNTGSASMVYIYSPKFVELSGTFVVDAVENAVFQEESGLLTRGDSVADPVSWVQDTDTVIVGIFPAGQLTITTEGGGVRYSEDTNVFFNTPMVSGGIGEVRTTLGVIPFGVTTHTFTITDQQAPIVVEAWYQEDDNNNNQGNISYSYSFVPEEPILLEPPPVFDGRGVFYGTSLYDYQNIALEEISKAFSSTLFNRFVIEMHQALVINGYISGSPLDGSLESGTSEDEMTYHFFPEDYYSSNVLTEDILAQTRQRLLDNIGTVKSELFDAFESVFESEEKTLINLSDYSQYTVGGQFEKSQILDVDLTLFNGVWFDLDNFYTVSPKVSNNTGISVLASLNVDIKHATKTRFEFRIFESVSQTELDRVLIESLDYNRNEQIGNILKDYVETYPIQLQYIGPVPQVKCTQDVFNKCVASSNLDVNSHVKLNASDLYSTESVHGGFKVITDRVKSLDISAKVGNLDSSVGGTNVIDLDTPRIYRVQWRMIIDEVTAEEIHKSKLSDIYFNANAPRSDDFEISLNVYNLGDVGKKKILSQGVVSFNDQNKKRISVPSLSTATGSEYSISLSCNRNINVWYDDKTGGGFTIVAEKKFTGEVSWIINKQPGISSTETNTKEKINELPLCLVDFKPTYGTFSNFDIFKKEGYEVNIITQLVDDEPVTPSSSSEEENEFYVDENGPECSQNCINDCPDDWQCSSLCPNAAETQSGCACCECINDSQCPEGFVCNEFGECIPFI